MFNSLDGILVIVSVTIQESSRNSKPAEELHRIFCHKSSIRMFWHYLIYFVPFYRLFKPFFSLIAFTTARWIQQARSHKNGKASEFFTEIPKVISKFLSSGIGNELVHCFVRVQELKEKEIMI